MKETIKQAVRNSNTPKIQWQVYLLTLIAFSFLGCTGLEKHSSKTDDQLRRDLDQIVLDLYEKGEFNGCVLVKKNGKVVLEKAYGYSNEAKGELLTTNSIFPLASVSKQFTAMAILLLVQDGKLALSDPLSKFFKGFPDWAEDVTIHHLLTHTSGIPSAYDKYIKAHRLGKPTNGAVEKFAKAQKLEFSPGEKYNYCNSGYNLLGSIVAKVSGESYAEFVKKRICSPLKMNSSYANDGYKRPYIEKNEVTGYYYSGGVKKGRLYGSVAVGQGGIFSTTGDLLKWDKALYTEQLLKNNLLKKMFYFHVNRTGEKSSDYYGYGWKLHKDPQLGKTSFHSGGNRTTRNMIVRYTDSNHTIIILGNLVPRSNKAAREKMVKGLRDLLANEAEIAFNEKINEASYFSIVEALQYQAKKSAPAFPLEAYDGGAQSLMKGLQNSYFGYAERRYSYRTDFHPAMDLAYSPTESGMVVNEAGESKKVRAPSTYLKKVLAIQKGVLVKIALAGSGYKLTLKHRLEKPYLDNNGRVYDYFYTCYRHLDSRSLAYLDKVAQKTSNDPEATHKDLFGKYAFETGEQIALVGFNPFITSEVPRVHLDFSLNLYKDPDKGGNIRKYALNPLLLFPPFEYVGSESERVKNNTPRSYSMSIDEKSIIPPSKDRDGQLTIEIHSGYLSNGVNAVTRYFALNGFDLSLHNNGEKVAGHRVDRHLKQGYNTKNFQELDTSNKTRPYFHAPSMEQGDVYKMKIVIPKVWIKKTNYDWSKSGFISVNLNSIWTGYLKGHQHTLKIPLHFELADNK